MFKAAIVNSLTNDLSSIEIGTSIHVSEITFPEGVMLVSHGQDDPVIATAVKPKVVEDVVDETAESEDDDATDTDAEKAEEKQ